MSRPSCWLIIAGLSFTFLTAPGCGPRNAADNLPGTYYRTDKVDQPGYLQKIRLTEDKCIMDVPMAGEVAQPYTVDHNNLYVGGPGEQLLFHLDGPGTISNRGMMGVEGTYVKGKE
jgi:hypothetical protein